MILRLQSRAVYELSAQTFILLMVEPLLRGEAHQVLNENLITSPTSRAELWKDLYGNPQRHFTAPEGRFSFEFSARVEVQPNEPLPDEAIEHAPHDIPAECMIYTVPSRYCQSDKLTRMALSEFGHLPMGGSRVNAIATWINQKLEYQYGTSDAMTDAFDTATSRIGVCRDFAHLLISFCRALGIPARYVSGYCLELEPPDFHAYVQVYLSRKWHNIDATFAGTRPALVPIAVGRDAADVAMTTLFGTANFIEQYVSVERES
jgi:transglutaminase-like putative cysteine protease